MHGPHSPDGCSGCTYAADAYDGAVAHLNAHDVTFVMASRSPLASLRAYKRRMGWRMPWVSCETAFARDFGAWTEEDRRNGTGFNSARRAGAAIDLRENELMGLSAFELRRAAARTTASRNSRDGATSTEDPGRVSHRAAGRGHVHEPRTTGVT